jgi:hypothetical protein
MLGHMVTHSQLDFPERREEKYFQIFSGRYFSNFKFLFLIHHKMLKLFLKGSNGNLSLI